MSGFWFIAIEDQDIINIFTCFSAIKAFKIYRVPHYYIHLAHHSHSSNFYLKPFLLVFQFQYHSYISIDMGYSLQTLERSPTLV